MHCGLNYSCYNRTAPISTWSDASHQLFADFFGVVFQTVKISSFADHSQFFPQHVTMCCVRCHSIIVFHIVFHRAQIKWQQMVGMGIVALFRLWNRINFVVNQFEIDDFMRSSFSTARFILSASIYWVFCTAQIFNFLIWLTSNERAWDFHINIE